jgi:hypothetical protein
MMKRMTFFILFACISVHIWAVDNYREVMLQTIQTLDTTKTVVGYQAVTGRFEQIATVQKTDWLPLYYAAYSSIMLSLAITDNTKKDEALTHADELIERALKIKSDESELFVLKAFQRMAYISVEPMQRGMQYVGVFHQLLGKAEYFNANNPRISYLRGLMLTNTPEQFGGGAAKGLPHLKKALEKFNTVEVSDSIAPHWGKAHCLQLVGSK